MRENYSLVGNNEFDHVIGNCFRKKQGEINKFHFIFNKSLSFLLLLNIEKISCYSMIAKFWANASFSVHCFFFSCQTDFSIVGKYLKFLKKKNGRYLNGQSEVIWNQRKNTISGKIKDWWHNCTFKLKNTSFIGYIFSKMIFYNDIKEVGS